MCICLSLSSEDARQSRHVSLLHVLMREKYDTLLPRSFPYKVSVCLHDYTGAEQHMIDSFSSDAQLDRFQWPQSEMNVTGAIPKFCPLEAIISENNPYVQNGVMFIKVMVHRFPIPDNILPYAFDLDPGIPAETRFAMIQAKIDQSHSHSESTSA